MLFWCALLVYPLTFGDIYNEGAYTLVNITQQACFVFCVLSFICSGDNRKANALTLMGVYSLYAVFMDAIFNEVTSLFYLLESLTFCMWSAIIMTRYDHETLPNIDHNNVLLAFYKGEKGSFLMRFSNLFGLDVKSMCIMAGDKALALKQTKPGFSIISGGAILKEKDKYFIVDTGKPITDEFLKKMQDVSQRKARKFGLRIRCIEGVSDLLRDLGEEYDLKHPWHAIPALYLRYIL